MSCLEHAAGDLQLAMYLFLDLDTTVLRGLGLDMKRVQNISFSIHEIICNNYLQNKYWQINLTAIAEMSVDVFIVMNRKSTLLES